MQAFLPQFVIPEHGNTAAQVLVLGLLLIVMGLAFHILVAVGAGRLGSWLRRQPRVNAWLEARTRCEVEDFLAGR